MAKFLQCVYCRLAKIIEQLDTTKQQHDGSLRDQKTKTDELKSRYKYVVYRSVYSVQMVLKFNECYLDAVALNTKVIQKSFMPYCSVQLFYLRWLKMVSRTFPDVYFDGSHQEISCKLCSTAK